MDRNKTTLTHDVTNAVVRAMDSWGFKPVETEVTVCRGWCADVAGVICPTQTELINLKLLPRRPAWNTPAYEAWKASLDAMDRIFTCLVEVKTSRRDYCGDRKWIAEQPTDLAYVAFPRGLVKAEEWPVGWGILEYSGETITRRRTPTIRTMAAEQQRDVILNIAVRRDHHTRYERHREFQKAQRLSEAEERPISRLGELARLVLSIAKAERGSVEETLNRYHNLSKLPGWVLEPLRELYGVHPEAVAMRSEAVR